MPSTTGHYDHTLLASAPVATKKQIQEGYTTEILAPMRKPDATPAAASDPELAAPRTGSRPPTAAGLDDADFYPEKKKVPFWRTTKGVVILVLGAIAILGAIIGGAVGGTVGKNNSNNGDNSQPVVTGTGTAPPSVPAFTVPPKTDELPHASQTAGVPLGPVESPSQQAGPGTHQMGTQLDVVGSNGANKNSKSH